MPRFPIIRSTVDALKPHLPEGFRIIVQYSGSDDSGWFDNEYFQTKDGKTIYIDEKKPEPETILQEFRIEIHNELYPLLYGRFPGWEIGCDEVRGSHGHFTIDSATNTITQTHIQDFCSEEDISPEEKETF